jgi:hypothetical protein
MGFKSIQYLEKDTGSFIKEVKSLNFTLGKLEYRAMVLENQNIWSDFES